VITKLTRHGNSAALIVDRAIMEILNIEMDTPLEIVTDGRSLIVSPVRGDPLDDRLGDVLCRVNARHGETLRRLSE
jgi:antitoxin component of MazEF toxin-antitoxin module